MTRPMPGPPECLPTGFPHEGAAINAPGCLLHARSYRADSKRLADAECLDEYWWEVTHFRTWEKVRAWARFAIRPSFDDEPAA